MTREKKKIRSVAGQKFVPIKAPKKQPKQFDDPDSYESRKRRAQTRKKRPASVYERERRKDEDEDKPSKRRSRLKHPPEEVARKSLALLDGDEMEDADPDADADVDSDAVIDTKSDGD